MHEIAFYLGSRGIHWYGVCIAVGFLAALGLLQWKRDYAKLNSDQVFDIAMISLIAGIAGARIFHVIQFWSSSFASKPFVEVFRIDKGGLVFYGGFICAFTCILIYSKWKKISIPALIDLMGPAMFAAHAFGRIGCFMQGCCFGKPCSDGFCMGVKFPQGSLPAYRYPDMTGTSVSLYPVQLMEAGANFLLAALLLYLMPKMKRKGMLAGLYMTLYALIRFCIEFMRGDHVDSFLGLTPSQTIALFIMLPIGVVFFIVSSSKKTVKESDHGNP